MKFKCVLSNCVYSFNDPLDIRAMKQSLDYIAIPEGEPAVEPPKVPVDPTTIVPVGPKPVAPSKPLPAAPVVPKAV